MLSASLLLTASLTTALASPVARQSCASGVHILTARGSNEDPGPGVMGSIVDAVLASIPNSDAEAVDYPATLTDYTASVAAGVADLTSLIEEYVDACPEAKIVLFGYSQGANVAGDVLCGTATNDALGEAYSSNIAAILQLGDPTHVAGLPFDAGTATRDGVFPRADTSACLQYADVWRAYCDADDLFCDSGASVDVHLAYVDKYGDEAAEWVVSTVD